MNVWRETWGGSWGTSWAEAVLPPIVTLILGAVSIRPALAGSARILAALSDEGVSSGPLLAGAISTDRSD